MADLINSSETQALIYSLIGGILPALFWLWFWMQEDKLHPEPRGRILLAFLGGMVAVALVYPLERWAYTKFGMTNMTITIWAIIEEIAKYAMVSITILHSRVFDEPIDAMEYLITCALGFAAMENTLFILNPLLEGQGLQSLITGNMRFLGASLLHVVSSAILGYCIAREFYRGRFMKFVWRIFGLSMAITLHAAFNAFIIYDNGSKIFIVFSMIWIASLGILLLFEKVKKLKAK
jgi:RsiW-degrading membrane proteinase PrsW (M82 family)